MMISVIIPMYNCGKYIEDAVKSVVNQTTIEPVEILLINDHSTDDTKEVLEQVMNVVFSNPVIQWNKKGIEQRFFEAIPIEMAGNRLIRYVENEKNLGVAESRNTGIRMAQGEYVAFLDGDDWWELSKLEKQISHIRKKGGVLYYTGRELMNPDGSTSGRIIEIPEEVDYRQLLRTNHIPCSSVVMKSEVAREFYMCHDELHEDYILWLQVLKKYQKAYGINEPMLKSRLVEHGKSRNKIKSAKMQLGVYRYMGIPWILAMGYFLSYTIHGIKKYSRI